MSETQDKIQKLWVCVGFLTMARSVLDKYEYKYDAEGEQTYISSYVTSGAVSFTIHGPDAKTAMRELRLALSGQWDKSGYGDTFSLTRYEPGKPVLRIDADRTAICERKVVGTEKVTIEAQPAKPFVPKHTEEREIVEWDCGNLLTDDDGRRSRDVYEEEFGPSDVPGS